jgi:hypothetical protein
MKKYASFWLSLILTTVLPHAGYSEESKSSQLQEQQKVTVLLPISWSAPSQCNLSVTIPEGFRSIQPLATWNESTLIEFIPEGESGDNWSEIITLNKLIGQRIPATQITSYLEKTLPTKSTNFKVIASSVEKTSSYLRSNLEVSYENAGRHEVLSCRYYSGPYDCAGIQYTIRPKSDQTDEQTLAKIEAFFEANIQIVDCETSTP